MKEKTLVTLLLLMVLSVLITERNEAERLSVKTTTEINSFRNEIELELEEYDRILAEKEEEEKRILEEYRRKEEEKLKAIEASKIRFRFEVSYYCPCEYCTTYATGITASGAYAQEGVTIAMPEDIPFGSQVHIENVGDFVNQDTGSYIKWAYDDSGELVMRVDVFVDSHEEALEKGRHYEYGYIIYAEE